MPWLNIKNIDATECQLSDFTHRLENKPHKQNPLNRLSCGMRRRVAVRLFKEICECIPDLMITAVSINRCSQNGEVELRICLVPNQGYLTEVESIVIANGLKFTEQAGNILIYEPQPLEVIA
jgi:hypothetical protein